MKRLAAVLAAVTLVLLGLPTVAVAAPGDATVVPIQVTGDPAKRFNLVVVGDGYTEAELPKFRAHLDKHLNVLWTIEPFKSYRSYVNVYAVELTSAESGVDCDPNLDSGVRNTPLGMGFWGGCNPNSVQRLLSVDGTAANAYADMVPGTSRANRQLLAIANSDTYGGAGGANATVSGGNALSALITPHELGHSLGGLQDEYDYLARGARGGPYQGGEPDSVHHSLLTEQQMAAQQQKWWRWLGEPSESGGTIGRSESGLYSGSGVWRPSKHSMMKSLGYYFDQVSRERMTQRISAKTSIIADSVPADAPVGADRVLWIETTYPVNHQLEVTWSVDGMVVATDTRSLNLADLGLGFGRHTVTATVVDQTEFVRDPAVRDSAALTQSRTWTVDTGLSTPEPLAPDTFVEQFTTTTPTTFPIGAADVVYAETTHPTTWVPPVTWTLDGQPIDPGANDRAVDLEQFQLSAGTHTLTASVGGGTRTWTVDATGPTAAVELSQPLLAAPGQSYVYNGPFTMRLTGADNNPGFVVREFRTDGDGWFNYFGWPTDPDAPFQFTPQGTTIDNLVYGKLGTPRSSPWDQVPTSYGRHTIEYRSIDASGNIGAANSFAVTLLPEPPACTKTLSGAVRGPLLVGSGVTCLTGATVSGPVWVRKGAGLYAVDSTINGPLVASEAAVVELLRGTVRGPVAIGQTPRVTVVGGAVGPAWLSGNRVPVLAGVTVNGPLNCTGNAAAPDNLQAPNTVRGPATGQCAGV